MPMGKTGSIKLVVAERTGEREYELSEEAEVRLRSKEEVEEDEDEDRIGAGDGLSDGLRCCRMVLESLGDVTRSSGSCSTDEEDVDCFGAGFEPRLRVGPRGGLFSTIVLESFGEEARSSGSCSIDVAEVEDENEDLPESSCDADDCSGSETSRGVCVAGFCGSAGVWI